MFTLLVTFFLLSIVFSFLCSMWEAVLLSITPSWAQGRLSDGDPIAEHLQDFKENIDRPLSAILTLNTIAHTVGAIGVGKQATLIWADSSPWITGFVVPAVMTLAILVLSEIIPKTIGATHWQRLAPFTVTSLRLLLVVLRPFVWLSQFVTRALKRGSDAAVLTRTDFVAMAELGAREGVFAEGETHMITNLMQFRSIQARDVMTPRTVVSAVAEEGTVAGWWDAAKNLRFSRMPTYHSGSKDRITGYVLKDELLEAIIEGQGEERIGRFRREIVTIGEEHPVTELFNTLTERREHIALVLDDFGGMAGIVSMEDVIETLLGLEIVDETDGASDMRVLARRHRTQRARALGLVEKEQPEAPADAASAPGAPTGGGGATR